MPRFPEVELHNADISREASRDINKIMQMSKKKIQNILRVVI